MSPRADATPKSLDVGFTLTAKPVCSSARRCSSRAPSPRPGDASGTRTSPEPVSMPTPAGGGGESEGEIQAGDPARC